MNITFTVPAMMFGGAERVISILASNWVKKGHNVSIIISGNNPKCVYDLDARVNLCCIGGLKGIPGIAHFNLMRSIRREVKKCKTDVVISFIADTFFYTAMSLIGTNIPLIYSERADPSKRMDIRGMKLYYKIIEKCSCGVVFQIDGAKQYFSKRVRENSVVILNPFNTEDLPDYNFESRKKEIVTMGRVCHQKNQSLLIDAFSLIANKFSDYVLKIYGDGELTDTLQNKIDTLGLSNQIVLMGAQKDVLNKINKASLFVLSSDYEGLPNALIEAMCIGIPSVSTDCSPGGARELIDNGENGLIVPCNDAKALANAMKKVLEDDELAIKISKNGRKIADRMESGKIAEKWLQFIEKYK